MVIVCAFSKRVGELGVELTFRVLFNLFFLKSVNKILLSFFF